MLVYRVHTVIVHVLDSQCLSSYFDVICYQSDQVILLISTAVLDLVVLQPFL